LRVFFILLKLLGKIHGSKFCYAVLCEYANRVVSILHAIVCTVALIVVSTNAKSLRDRVDVYDYFIFVTLGYELYDMFCLVYMNAMYKEEELQSNKSYSNARNGAMIFIHHSFLVVSCILYLRVGTINMGSMPVAAMFFMEFSSMFMHVRWILINNSFGATLVFQANTCILLLSFVVTRIMLWPYLFNRISQEKNISFFESFQAIPKDCLFGILFLVLINFYWFFSILYAATKSRPVLNQTEQQKKVGLSNFP